MKGFRILFVMFVVSVAAVSISNAEPLYGFDKIHKGASVAATESLNFLIKRLKSFKNNATGVSIPLSSHIPYGFQTDDNLDALQLGQPIRLYMIEPSVEENFKYGSLTTMEEILSPSNQVYFPVMLDGQLRLFIAVAEDNGVWKVIFRGGSTLANELEKAKKAWPVEKGYSIQLIKSILTKFHAFHVPEYDKKNITLLSPYMPSPNKGSDNPYNELSSTENFYAKLASNAAEAN